jgi:hypothetical protein
MTLRRLRHLITRTGFGCTNPEMNRALAMGYEAYLDALIEEIRTEPLVVPPVEVTRFDPPDRQRDKASSPRLREALEQITVQHTVDYRRLYSTVVRDWWRRERLPDFLRAHAPIKLLAGETAPPAEPK